MTNISLEEIARIYRDEIWKLHGIPKKIIRLYEVLELTSSTSSSTTKLSFINNEVDNLIKYMKFI